jgi:NADH dehydrogenase FAD-containing subunit
MKKLVIIGTGSSHVHLLLSLTRQALEGVQVTLVAPSLRQLYGPMLPDFVSGVITQDEGLIDLEARLKRSGIRYLPFNVVALDDQAQTLTLANGSLLDFDWLSINNGDVVDRAQLELKLPGVREHGLFLHPSEAFSKLWPSVLTLAESRALRIAVLGDSLQSIEIALAVRHRLPSASITLVLRSAVLAHQCSDVFQATLMLALKQGQITVLDDHAVRLSDGLVLLGCGADLVCDLPMVALGAPVPGWLAGSGLALDEQGFMATEEPWRSSSHPCVFSADQATATHQQTVWRRHASQLAADSASTQSLFAAIKGLPKTRPQAPHYSLTLVSGGGRVAMANWGKYSVQGRWLWRLKNWIDSALVQRLRQP